MRNLKSNISKIKTIAIAAMLLAMCAVEFVSYGQQKSAVPLRVNDRYSMSPDSRFKPELRYILVRIKGDNGVSIVDLIDGKVVSRNFAPVTNSKGKVNHNNWTTPVLDDIFCVRRGKSINDYRWESETTVYHDATHPAPVVGLIGLYSANIINPNLFPISRHGERIKFVDSKGNVKFTVMPIDGKEPRSVNPMVSNGIIEVEVVYDVETEDYIDKSGGKHKSITNSTTKYGAIDTSGKWIIYPEWDSRFEQPEIGTIIGQKKGKFYRIYPSGKSIQDTRFDDFDRAYNYHWPVNGEYIFEEFFEDGKHVTNVYDLKQNYITTLDNADWIRPNRAHKDILCVRRDFHDSSNGSYDNLFDLSRNTVISKNYKNLEALPDGNYLGRSREDSNGITKCWYVKADGTEIPLPDNCEFPLRHPGMALYYKPEINRFIVIGKNGTPGYICDSNGNRIGNLQIEEFYNTEWEAEPVKSSYWRKHIIGEDDD